MKKILLLFLILFSCNKNDDKIAPPLTQENTFSCEIEGELFVPRTHGFYSFDGILVPIHDEKWLVILSDGKNNLYIHLTDLFNNDTSKTIQKSDGDFDFLYDINNSIELKIKGNNYNDKNYFSYSNTGSVKIEKTESNKLILSFDELKLMSSTNTSDIIKLTKGKLNIDINTLNQ